MNREVYYIGVDLAWTYKHPSGICIINNQKEIVYIDALCFDDEELARVINQYSPSVVSVDAPLIINNENGSRLCDRLLMRHPFHGTYLKLFATSRSYMMRAYGCIRGERIVQHLKGHNLNDNLLETFPTGVYLVLFPDLYPNKYKLSSRLKLEELKRNASVLLDDIRRLGFSTSLSCALITSKKEYKNFEDKLDSLLCALNSYYANTGQRFEVDDNGCIVLPRCK